MCPPAPVSPPADIPLCWTDEELCMFLEKITPGSPLPRNVLDESPYNYSPSNLPENVWYLIRSKEKDDSDHGFWKAKGEACEIFTNSSITGWRTTLEFCEGQALCEHKTDWVMQEYKITWKGQCKNSKPKEPGSLCRVFRDGHNPNHEMHHKQAAADGARGNPLHSKNSVSIADKTSGQGSLSESKVKSSDENPRLLALSDTFQKFPVDSLPEDDYISRGDFLELDDLANPATPSSISDNSSCLSLSSDECFDSLRLLQDLEDETNQNLQGQNPNLNFNVRASVRPSEVVISQPTSGSLITGAQSKSPIAETLKDVNPLPDSAVEGQLQNRVVQKQATRSHNVNIRSETTSNSHHGATSSSGHGSASEGRKKFNDGRMKKLKRKYLCFFPF